jgi:hypothetical protein
MLSKLFMHLLNLSIYLKQDWFGTWSSLASSCHDAEESC